MGKIASGLGIIFCLAGCITPSQSRSPAQEIPNATQATTDNPATNAINKVRAARHQGVTPVPHATRTCIPVKTQGEEVEKEPTTKACGDERWDIKTLTDSAAEKDETVFANTLIQFLRAPPTAKVSDLIDSSKHPKPDPWSPTMARLPFETEMQKMAVQIDEYKLEADHDYHIVITDPGVDPFPEDKPKNAMIIESPDPNCPGGIAPNLVPIPTAYKNNFIQVRAQFDKIISERNLPPPGELCKVTPPIKVFVTGLPFFDKLHGQTGVAPNGIEIHPILDLEEDTQAP